MRIEHREFLALPLRAHSLLRGARLRDVSVVDLPGGGEGRTATEVRALLEVARQAYPARVRALIALRRMLGKALRWDAAARPLRLAFAFPHELILEADNATVRAFACLALRPQAGGYRLYLAVYTENVSWFTPLYMTLIEPFRRFVVYPAMLKNLREAWVTAYQPSFNGG
jgi:Protein of unknown function (DUF2867)